QILIQTVKLAFSVTNNVIRLKPPSDAVSPLEQALTQHGGHGSNLIVVAPMSVYACLGSDAAAIRDAFLARLQSKTEDMRIKVMILEFLTVAVETQPGVPGGRVELPSCGVGSNQLETAGEVLVSSPCVLEACAFVMKIIGLEIYYVVRTGGRTGGFCETVRYLLDKIHRGDISQLPQLLLSVCETVKDEALALIDNTRHIDVENVCHV
ncbi:hypothetical protein GOODEAATRI_020297, partial [Goodea atripinnis]